MEQATILSAVDEWGQARKEELSEVFVVATRTGLKALGTSMLWGTVISGGRYVFGDDVTILSAVVTYGGVWAVSFGFSIGEDLDTHREGLQSRKEARSYAHPSSLPLEPLPDPDIVVRRGDKALVIPRGQPQRLPVYQPLKLTPPVVGAAIQASLENEGRWSRKIITGVYVGSQRISRALFEKMTYALASQQFLQPRSGGSHALPPDCLTYEDVRRYIPALPPIGGSPQAPRLPTPPTCPPTRPLANLAEKRRERWLECGCDAKVYLRGGR